VNILWTGWCSPPPFSLLAISLLKQLLNNNTLFLHDLKNYNFFSHLLFQHKQSCEAGRHCLIGEAHRREIICPHYKKKKEFIHQLNAEKYSVIHRRLKKEASKVDTHPKISSSNFIQYGGDIQDCHGHFLQGITVRELGKRHCVIYCRFILNLWLFSPNFSSRCRYQLMRIPQLQRIPQFQASFQCEDSVDFCCF
jgi:hypothetical protein